MPIFRLIIHEISKFTRERGCEKNAKAFFHSPITSCESEESSRVEKLFCILSDSAEIVPLRGTLSSGAPRHLLSKEGLTGSGSAAFLRSSPEATPELLTAHY